VPEGDAGHPRIAFNIDSLPRFEEYVRGQIFGIPA
jgi:hypothetical protein